MRASSSRRIRVSATQLSRMISETVRLAESDVVDFMAARRQKDIRQAQQPAQRSAGLRASLNLRFVVRFGDRPAEMMRNWLRKEVENATKPMGDLWKLGAASHGGSTVVITMGDEPGSLKLGLSIEPREAGWDLPSSAEREAQEEIFSWLQGIVGETGTIEQLPTMKTSSADAAQRLQQILDRDR